jgi:hypothetical protein
MTMKAYEFSTKVTRDSKLPIPDAYAKNIPIGAWNKAWDKVEAEMEDATNV